MKEGQEMEAEKDPSVDKMSKLDKLRSRLKLHTAKTSTKDLSESLQMRSWQMLSKSSKKKTGGLLRAFFRLHMFQLVGTFSLIICAVLFTFQAYLAFRSFQMMNQLHKKPQIPEILYRIYFEGNDWAVDLDRVDLRANTSIFIH